MYRRVLVLIALGFWFLPEGIVFAQDYVTQEQYNALSRRVLALEQQLGRQERSIQEQHALMVEQKEKIAVYESKLSELDNQLHRQSGVPMAIADGLEIGSGGTMIIQGTNNVNNATEGVEKKVSRADTSYSADITLGKEFSQVNGKVFLHLEAGQGAGFEDDLTLYSNVNRDADNDNNVRLTEFWYEQGLFKDRVALTFGKLDPTAYFDNNEAANDETTQFLGRIFRNSPVIEFPDNTAGIRLAYLPVDWLELNYGILDGDGDWEKIGDSLFNIGQVAFKTSFFQLPGNYRLLGWHSNVNHTKWSDLNQVKEATYGFGLSFDQKISESVTLFARYGWQNPKVYNPEITAVGGHNYSLEHSWSAGLQVEGKPWKRENDVLGFTVGQAFASGDYKKYGSATVASPQAKPEGHLEAYYRIWLNEHLSVSPDLQYIWNPFGRDVADDKRGIFVGGMRAQVDF
jgi:carbohydrate-selective porin OprB/uncharacterized coiled-coil protein SlyX